MLVGVLLASLGAASAIPTATPTTREDATRVALGPRRNGYSDLPSAAYAYNAGHWDNRIPDYVLANDPATGGDAIIYTRDEIYTAMQVRGICDLKQVILELTCACSLIAARL